MNSISFRAFTEELSDILGIQKESAGMIRDIGTAIGNTLKGFTTPIKATKLGIQESFKSEGGLVGKTLNYGLGVGMPAIDFTTSVIPAQDPTGRNRSRLQRAAEFGASTAGGFIGMGAARGLKHPFIGSMAGSLVGGETARLGTAGLFGGGKALKRRVFKTPDAPMGTQPGELETPHVPITGERPADIAG